MAKHARRSFGKIRQLPSGRFQASYVGPDDARRYNAPMTFDTRGDADAWLAEKLTDIRREAWQRPEPKKAKTAPVPSFAAYSEQWMSRRQLRKSTRKNYRRLRRHLVSAFGASRLDEITPTAVAEWFFGWGDEKLPTRKDAYVLLGSILNTAIADGTVPGPNPCHVKGGSRYRRETKTVPATPAEVDAMAAAIRPEWSALVLLAAWCQLRFGELAELRRKDIDLDAGIIQVQRSAGRVDGEMVIGPPKSEAGEREVTIPPHVLPRIAEHVEKYAQPGRNGLLFVSITGLQLYPGLVESEWSRAREAAGRGDLRFHDLRHTGATMAAQAGATTAELMARLGHSTPGTAMIYQHATRERDAAIADALSDLAEAGNVVPLRRARKAKPGADELAAKLAAAEAELAELRALLGETGRRDGRPGKSPRNRTAGRP